MEAFFWICVGLVVYPYAIYPGLLILLNRITRRKAHQASEMYLPGVTIILPVHNEAKRVVAKIGNILALDYPKEKMHILIVGDGCTDDSLDRAVECGRGFVTAVPLAQRSGKAAALNAGLELAKGEIVVFTDAGIMLDRLALRRLVAHFEDPQVGCVSGEDYIEGAQTEGLYGRLELLLRREEALLHSIAGASGCFYAQRLELCAPFRAGMAPDFLSVLDTVRKGRRALAEPEARGSMTATASQRAEFSRKVRTFLRGITALFGNAGLLNPFAHPAFSFILWSHKLMRWFAPLAMVGALAASFMLRENRFYLFLFALQLALYLAAVLGMIFPSIANRLSIIRLSAFFVIVNAAALKALALWALGNRIEVWQPTQRPQ